MAHSTGIRGPRVCARWGPGGVLGCQARQTARASPVALPGASTGTAGAARGVWSRPQGPRRVRARPLSLWGSLEALPELDPNPCQPRPHSTGAFAWSLTATPHTPTAQSTRMAGLPCRTPGSSAPPDSKVPPGLAAAPKSTSAPAVGCWPPGHSRTLGTSGPRTFQADGECGSVRSGSAVPRSTRGLGRSHWTSQKIPILCGHPSPETPGPSQVPDSAL